MTKKRIAQLLNCSIVSSPNTSFLRMGIKGVVSNLTMEQFNNVKSRKGFTLIEIMVVIAIIGILSSFLIGAFSGLRQTTRDSQRKTDLRLIQSALEIYRSDTGKYSYTSPIDPCGGSWTVDGTVYMQTIPCDPLSEAEYTYRVAGGYELIACLEDVDDKDRDDVDGGGKDSCGTPPNPDGKVSFTLQNP